MRLQNPIGITCPRCDGSAWVRWGHQTGSETAGKLTVHIQALTFGCGGCGLIVDLTTNYDEAPGVLLEDLLNDIDKELGQ